MQKYNPLYFYLDSFFLPKICQLYIIFKISLYVNSSFLKTMNQPNSVHIFKHFLLLIIVFNRPSLLYKNILL